MSDTPLIRRQVSADRGVSAVSGVRVTTADVMACIADLPETWTTTDISSRLQIPEYSVRTAVAWLIERGDVARAGSIMRPSPRCRCPYRVATYRIEVKPEAIDFSALYRAFGLPCRS